MLSKGLVEMARTFLTRFGGQEVPRDPVSYHHHRSPSELVEIPEGFESRPFCVNRIVATTGTSTTRGHFIRLLAQELPSTIVQVGHVKLRRVAPFALGACVVGALVLHSCDS